MSIDMPPARPDLKDHNGRWIIRNHVDVLRFANAQTRRIGYMQSTNRSDEYAHVKECERDGLIVFIGYACPRPEYPGEPLRMIFELTPRGEAALAALPT